VPGAGRKEKAKSYSWISLEERFQPLMGGREDEPTNIVECYYLALFILGDEEIETCHLTLDIIANIVVSRGVGNEEPAF
jgi:hypothetical protein